MMINERSEVTLTKFKWVSLLVLVVLIMSAIIACAQPAPGQKPVIKIGYSIPLNVSFGANINKALDIAVPQFNADYGVKVKGTRYDLQIIKRDDNSSADLGRTNAERFINEDKVKYVFYIGSATTTAAFPVTEQAGVLLFSGAAVDQHLLPPSKYTFRSAESFHSKAVKWKYIREHFPKATKVGLIVSDNAGGKTDADRCKAIAPIYNLVLTDEYILYYPPGAKDFTAIATKLANLNPDVVVFNATEADTAIGLQIKALRAAGYKGGLAKTEEVNVDELKNVASPQEYEGLLGKCQPDQLPQVSKMLKDFKAGYQAQFKEWPTFLYGFLSCVPMFKAAAEKANSLEVPDIANAVNGLEWESWSGPFETFCRQDLKVTRPVGVESIAPMGYIKNGVLTWEKTYSLKEAQEAAGKVYGVTKTCK